jgi:hypothetical protein
MMTNRARIVVDKITALEELYHSLRALSSPRSCDAASLTRLLDEVLSPRAAREPRQFRLALSMTKSLSQSTRCDAFTMLTVRCDRFSISARFGACSRDGALSRV